MEASCPRQGAGPASESLSAQFSLCFTGHTDSRPGRGGQATEEADSTECGRGGLPWPGSMPARVSVYSTAPQGLASLPSVRWRVRRPPWLWPSLEDCTCLPLTLLSCSQASTAARGCQPARTPGLPLLGWWLPSRKVETLERRCA